MLTSKVPAWYGAPKPGNYGRENEYSIQTHNLDSVGATPTSATRQTRTKIQARGMSQDRMQWAGQILNAT